MTASLNQPETQPKEDQILIQSEMSLFSDGNHLIKDYFDMPDVHTSYSPVSYSDVKVHMEWYNKMDFLDGSLKFYRPGTVINLDPFLSIEVSSK